MAQSLHSFALQALSGATKGRQRLLPQLRGAGALSPAVSLRPSRHVDGSRPRRPTPRTWTPRRWSRPLGRRIVGGGAIEVDAVTEEELKKNGFRSTRRTKHVGTIGPATCGARQLEALAVGGTNVAPEST